MDGARLHRWVPTIASIATIGAIIVTVIIYISRIGPAMGEIEDLSDEVDKHAVAIGESEDLSDKVDKHAVAIGESINRDTGQDVKIEALRDRQDLLLQEVRRRLDRIEEALDEAPWRRARRDGTLSGP